MDQVLMVLFIYYLWPARCLYTLKHSSQIPNYKNKYFIFSLHSKDPFNKTIRCKYYWSFSLSQKEIPYNFDGDIFCYFFKIFFVSTVGLWKWIVDIFKIPFESYNKIIVNSKAEQFI